MTACPQCKTTEPDDFTAWQKERDTNTNYCRVCEKKRKGRSKKGEKTGTAIRRVRKAVAEDDTEMLRLIGATMRDVKLDRPEKLEPEPELTPRDITFAARYGAGVIPPGSDRERMDDVDRLLAKWRADLLTYPIDTSENAAYAHKTLELCIRELEAATGLSHLEEEDEYEPPLIDKCPRCGSTDPAKLGGEAFCAHPFHGQ